MSRAADGEFMQRLKRLDEIFADAPVYFVTACTWRRQTILATAEVKAAVDAFGADGPAAGAWLGAYVVMPDHLHAFVALDGERCPLSRWMKALKACVTKVVRAQGVTGPVWQKGFFDHLLRNGESASDKWAYVRANPVRAGLVAAEEEWPLWGQVHLLRSNDCDLR